MLNAVGPREIQRKRPDAFQQKSVQAVQEAAKQKLETRGLDNQSLPESEQVALSKELSEELDSHQEHQGLDALLANLAQGNQPKLDQKIDDKVKEVGGASQVENQSNKPKAQEIKSEWTPDTEKGKIHKGGEKIGDVRLTSKKKSPDSVQAPNPVNQVGHSRPGTKGAPKTDAPRPVGQVEPGSNTHPDRKADNQQSPQSRRPTQDKVELSGESQKQLQSLQQSGNPEVAREAEQKAQQSSQKAANGEPEGDLGTIEVKTKANNWNQSAEVRPAGEVKDGDTLRYYQPLDGISPDTLETLRAMQGNQQSKVQEKGEQLGLRPDEQQKLQQPQAVLK